MGKAIEVTDCKLKVECVFDLIFLIVRKDIQVQLPIEAVEELIEVLSDAVEHAKQYRLEDQSDE